MELRINPQARVRWFRIGRFGTLVMVVDDAVERPEELRHYALSLSYNIPKVGDYYPGLKAVASVPGCHAMGRWAAETTLARLHGHKKRPPYLTTEHLWSPCQFAVMTCDPRRLPDDYVDQHTDNSAWLASVLHLSHECASRGTAFWAHRPTGLESWLPNTTGSRTPMDTVHIVRLEEALGLRLTEQLHGKSIIGSHGVANIFKARPKRRRMSMEEDSQWRLLRYVPAKFNRLVVYPTWQIHSLVDASPPRRLDTDNVRLTMNQFIDYPMPLGAFSQYPWHSYRRVAGLSGQ